MAKIWVLVGDENSARMFLTDRAAPLVEKEAHTAANAADKTGKQTNTSDSDHVIHAMDGGRDPRAEDERRFARVLADRLREARLSGSYERLFLVAPPAFLGALRPLLDAGTRDAVVGEMPKNLAQLKADSIRTHLPELL
ncbi:MAG: host attachment protein [Gammaproteobacteria bacterium]|nr:host attachment protein [Gammaproteobacteria bacterium]